MSSPWRHPPLKTHNHYKQIADPKHLFDFICISQIEFLYFDSFDMSQSHALLSITVLNTVYVYKYLFASKNKQCIRLGFSVHFWPWPPLFSFIPPCITAYTVTVRDFGRVASGGTVRHSGRTRSFPFLFFHEIGHLKTFWIGCPIWHSCPISNRTSESQTFDFGKKAETWGFWDTRSMGRYRACRKKMKEKEKKTRDRPNKNPHKLWLTVSGARQLLKPLHLPRTQVATQQRKGRRPPQKSALQRRHAAPPPVRPPYLEQNRGKQ